MDSFNKEEEVKTFDDIREAIRPFELGIAETPFAERCSGLSEKRLWGCKKGNQPFV
jgi:hypothetical protein